jgi:hypothetical protein
MTQVVVAMAMCQRQMQQLCRKHSNWVSRDKHSHSFSHKHTTNVIPMHFRYTKLNCLPLCIEIVGARAMVA